MTTTDTVVFDRVTKRYGGVRAVDDLTLTLRPGETVALLGPNGAGKSTTLDLLLGLKRPDSGSVTVLGTGPREAIVAGRVGAMLQSGGLMGDVTVAELVRLACGLHPGRTPSSTCSPAPGSPRSPAAGPTSCPAARPSGSASRSPPPGTAT